MRKSEPMTPLRDWAEEAWRFLASDFSDSPEYEKAQRKRVVRYLGDALDGRPVPSSLDPEPAGRPSLVSGTMPGDNLDVVEGQANGEGQGIGFSDADLGAVEGGASDEYCPACDSGFGCGEGDEQE